MLQQCLKVIFHQHQNSQSDSPPWCNVGAIGHQEMNVVHFRFRAHKSVSNSILSIGKDVKIVRAGHLLGDIHHNASSKESQLATIHIGQCCWSLLPDPLLHYSDSYWEAFPDPYSSSTVSCKSVHCEASCHQQSYNSKTSKFKLFLHEIKAHSSTNALICCSRIISASPYHQRWALESSAAAAR